MIVEFLRKELRPKDVRLTPDEFLHDRAWELLERTLVRRWVNQWLQHLHWYHTVALAPCPRLEDLLSCPVVESSWKRTHREESLKRFGILWKLFDLVTARGVRWSPPSLGLTHVTFPGWIFGGYSGRDFMLAPVGVIPSPGVKVRRTIRK